MLVGGFSVHECRIYYDQNHFRHMVRNIQQSVAPIYVCPYR